MRLTCPCCGVTLSLDAMAADGCAREVMAIALQFPAGLGDRVVRYLALFRPKGRGLAWHRAKRLLLELVEPIERGTVERHGRVWPAPADYWRAALDEILAKRDTLQLPLKSHGYLLEILVGLAQRAEAAAEQKREQEKRSGLRSPDPLARTREAAAPAEMPRHVRDELDKLGVFRRALKEGSGGDDA